MLRIYYGPDSFSRTEAVRALETELDSDGMLASNTTEFDAANFDLAALIAACDTVPFLAANRLVVVSGLLAGPQARPGRGARGRRPRTGDSQRSNVDDLAAYVPRMPPSTTLLLLDDDIRSPNALLDALKPMAAVELFPLKNEQQILAWIATRARAMGTALEPRAASLLARGASGDLWSLASDLEKLSLYARGRAVTESDVRNLVPASQDSNIFAMIDAVIAGNMDQALQQLRLLQQEGAAGPYLITMIARQYRQLVIAQDLLAVGAASTRVAQALDIRSESVLRRVVNQAGRLGAAYLEWAYERILTADLAIKRGETEETVALELLVIDLSGGERSFARTPAGRRLSS